MFTWRCGVSQLAISPSRKRTHGRRASWTKTEREIDTTKSKRNHCTSSFFVSCATVFARYRNFARQRRRKEPSTIICNERIVNESWSTERLRCTSFCLYGAVLSSSRLWIWISVTLLATKLIKTTSYKAKGVSERAVSLLRETAFQRREKLAVEFCLEAHEFAQNGCVLQCEKGNQRQHE